MSIPRLQIDGPKKSKKFVILTHGAGASSDSSFHSYFTEKLVELRYRVVRFDFPYMEQRSTTGRKRPPDKEDVLLETWRTVIREYDAERVVIGGKSMGGRIASMIADEMNVKGLVCFGYPFHPSGKPDKLRIDHLQDLQTPSLFLQGDRDKFGNREEVESYPLSESIKLHWVPDGDHGFSPRKSSGRVLNQNMGNAMRHLERFLFELWAE